MGATEDGDDGLDGGGEEYGGGGGEECDGEECDGDGEGTGAELEIPN